MSGISGDTMEIQADKIHEGVDIYSTWPQFSGL